MFKILNNFIKFRSVIYTDRFLNLYLEFLEGFQVFWPSKNTNQHKWNIFTTYRYWAYIELHLMSMACLLQHVGQSANTFGLHLLNTRRVLLWLNANLLNVLAVFTICWIVDIWIEFSCNIVVVFLNIIISIVLKSGMKSMELVKDWRWLLRV